ncbi:MAG TPA: tetratricopeptide repeat protein [Thermoanaerobaculia bacterium]|nr:tetratricopeptide repeat protein [Thermoanaerobaculia bacterium]
MNKDNVLFGVIGILLGFLAGYLLHEVMSARQPPRLRPGDTAAAAALGAGGDAAGAGGAGEAPADASGPGPGGAGGAGGPGGPQMAAIQQLREQVEKNPNDNAALLQLANANFEIQRWDRAQELYLRYLKMKPNQPGVMSDLGVTYRNQGKFQEALDLFRQVGKIDPTNWQSRFNEVVVLGIDLKQYDQAQQALVELRKMQPNNPDVERLAAAVESRRKAA